MNKDKYFEVRDKLAAQHIERLSKQPLYFILRAGIEKGMDYILENYSVEDRWMPIKDFNLIEGREYLISDGEDVVESQWYSDSKWSHQSYNDYAWVMEKPRPPKV